MQRKNVKQKQKKKPTVIPFSELTRMKEVVNRPGPPKKSKGVVYEYQKNKRLEEKKEYLLAKKKEKEDKIKKRNELREQERQKIEKEEDIYEAEQKDLVREYAKEKQFYTRDHVKSFLRKMRHCEMLEGLKMQEQLAVIKQQMEADIERDYELMTEKELFKMDEKIQKKQEEHQRLKNDQKNILEQQISQIKEKDRIKKIEEEKEVEKIRQVIMLNLYEEQFRKLKEKEKKLDMGAELIVANNKMLELKKQEIEKEKEEDKKIKQYNIKREKLLQQRKADELRKKEEKTAMRMRVIEKQAVHLEKLEKNRKAKMDADITKKEKELDEDDIKRKRALKDNQDHMKRLIRQQMEEKRELLKELKEEEKRMDQRCRDYIEEQYHLKAEKENMTNTRNKNKLSDMVTVNKKLHQEKIAKAKKERAELIEYNDEVLERIRKDDAEYKSFAEKCVKEWGDEGKNVLPIILELRRRKEELL